MAGGQSCTYVGTEYERPFVGQTQNFAAKVEYFDIDSIGELLKRLIADYYHWHFEQEFDLSDDEKQELNRLAKTAFTTFRSLFCDKSEFESPYAATVYLEQAYKDEEHNALDKFSEWCRQLLEEKEADEDDHIEYLDDETQEGLLEQLNPLVFSNSRFEEPSLWPLVKKVRIGIKGPRILEYITLIDLPGLDDTNRQRVDASYEMMRSCDAIWVVAKIDRAITETGVDSLLMRYGKAYEMVMICTGTDDNIDAGLATHLEGEGQIVGDHGELLRRERELRKLVKRLPKKIKARQNKLDNRSKAKSKKPKNPLTDHQKRKLRAEIKKLQAELKDAERELPEIAQERFELLVAARNANTIRRLQSEKSEHLRPGKTLPVFCVSNVHYAALKGAKIINGPRLDAEMTGIPALRQFVLRGSAPALLQAMEDFISYKFTVFMQGLTMWARSYSIQGSEELLASLKQPQKKASGLIDDFVDKLVEFNRKLVIGTITDTQPKLVEAAGDVINNKIHRWAWPTIRAFIRRDGNHRTSVAKQQSWNEQFLEAAKEDAEQSWDAFMQKEKELAKGLQKDLLKLLEGMNTTVQRHPAAYVLPMDRIKEIFDAHIDGIEQACREHRKELKKELR